jgi:carboxypeptidase Taq
MTSNIEKLKNKSRKITGINQASGVLHWDQEVMMPEKGIKARSQQLSVLSGLEHEIVASDELADLIDDIDPENLDEEDKAVYREVKREHEKVRKVDQELVEDISSKSSETVDRWKKARKEDDFSVVEEDLRELIELKREYANQIDSEREPYKVLFDDYEPYIRFETMEDIMEALRKELTDILKAVRASDVSPENVFEMEIGEERQMEMNRELLDHLGYDWDKGRLDLSEHPFTSGNQFDARITTRVDENDVSKTVMPTVHEFGHALYEQNLPEDKYGLPTGESRDLSIHESQSRLWENHIARSKPFWKFTKTLFKEFEDIGSEGLYRSINRVKEDNLIRVEADEISYHLHIYLRFKLERKLVNGEIQVEELPDLWNEKMDELLGITPETDKKGVLQDIHWYQGSIGYFTTYSLGSVLSAQIYRALDEDIENLDEKIEQGDFSQIRDWLEENIHQHGKVYRTEELIEKATGEKPEADYFLEYVRDKFSEIYSIEIPSA